MQNPRHAFITGGAGFIGSHLSGRLLREGWSVTAIDNFDPFYDRAVKAANIRPYLANPSYRFVEADIRDAAALRSAANGNIGVIVHLAARAGVRPSLLDPAGYQSVNVIGSQNMLELARECGVSQFVFASSSSVYGVNPAVPWSEEDHVLMPISPYASTKVSGELLGHVYSHLYGIRFVGLRFFTVYGPGQRPDLAIHKMTKLISEGNPVAVFGDGSTSRDYTYIDDIVDGIVAAMRYQGSHYEIINLGGSRTVTLLEMIRMLENAIGRNARLDFQPDQPGDVPRTFADTRKARALLGFEPRTRFEDGVQKFIQWFQECQEAGARQHRAVATTSAS